MFKTYLGSLLASLGLGEGRGSRLLTGLGRLSLRKKDISKCGPLPGDLPLTLKSSAGGISANATEAQAISSPAVTSHGRTNGRKQAASRPKPGAVPLVVNTTIAIVVRSDLPSSVAHQSEAYHFDGFWAVDCLSFGPREKKFVG